MGREKPKKRKNEGKGSSTEDSDLEDAPDKYKTYKVSYFTSVRFGPEKQMWYRTFRTEVRDNYAAPSSQPGSKVRNYETLVKSFYQRGIADLKTNIHYEHSTAKEKFASETSQIGTGRPLCSVIDQFKERNKRLELKTMRKRDTGPLGA